MNKDENVFSLRLDPKTINDLANLCGATGEKRSVIIRRLIREAAQKSLESIVIDRPILRAILDVGHDTAN